MASTEVSQNVETRKEAPAEAAAPPPPPPAPTSESEKKKEVAAAKGESAQESADSEPAVEVKKSGYVCSYCKLSCAKPSVLQKHIRAHTNERPYPCIPCGFAFKTKSNLYKHCRSRSHSLKLEGSEASKVREILFHFFISILSFFFKFKFLFLKINHFFPFFNFAKLYSTTY